MYYLLSIVLGLLPETLYFTLFLVYTKNLKEKKVRLFFLIGIAYFCCLLIQRYNFLFYIIHLFSFYIILKILYKSKVQIIDVFIITLSCLWIAILSSALMFLLKDDLSNYYYILALDKILLFMPFMFKNKFNNWYKKYCSLWNRKFDIKQPIKSITLRNFSLILLNGFIFFLNIAITNIINIINETR